MQEYRSGAIRELRANRGLNQQELGALAGLDQRQISRFERGAMPSVRNLLKIANGLKVGIDRFFLPI